MCVVLGSKSKDHKMEPKPDPKRPRTGAPDGALDPAPAEAPWWWVYNPMPQWFYNEGKGVEAVNIQGWLLKKGKWNDGAVLTDLACTKEPGDHGGWTIYAN